MLSAGMQPQSRVIQIVQAPIKGFGMIDLIFFIENCAGFSFD